MVRPPIKTPVKDILEYWGEKVYYQGEYRLRSDMAFGVDDPGAPRCFVCNRLSGRHDLDRAHLQDHILGGSDSPSNLVLLCKQCNREDMPPCSNAVIASFWIRRKRIEQLEDIGAALVALMPGRIMAWMEKYSVAIGTSLDTVAILMNPWITELREYMIRNGEWEQERLLGRLYGDIFTPGKELITQ